MSFGLSRRAWPLKRRWALTAEKHGPAFECAALPPADLGDGFDEVSEVLRRRSRRFLPASGRLGCLRPPTSMATHSNEHLCRRGSVLETAPVGGSALGPAWKAWPASISTSCAPAWSTPERQPCCRAAGGNRRRPSLPFRYQRRSSHRSCFKDAATTAEMLVGVGRHRTRRTETSQAACGWPKSPPTAPQDLGHFVETAAEVCRRQPAKTRRLVRATLRSPPIAFSMSMHVGTDRRSPRPAVDPAQIFDPTSKDGREASIVTGTCVCKAICRPIGDQFVMWSLQPSAGTRHS